MTAIAKFALVAIDTDDTERLARFYSDITGWPVQAHDGTGWIELESPGGTTIAFQQISDYAPPVWPGREHPQQLHLDFDVPDLDAGEAYVLGIGATKADEQPGETFRVFLDPSGHPFCLVKA